MNGILIVVTIIIVQLLGLTIIFCVLPFETSESLKPLLLLYGLFAIKHVCNFFRQGKLIFDGFFDVGGRVLSSKEFLDHLYIS